MHIVYAVTTCSDRVYRQLFENSPQKPAFQSQKYHRLLIEGLAAHTQVDVVANVPINRGLMDWSVLHLPEEREGGACYRYISAYRNPFRKLFHVALGTFRQTLRLARRDSVVMVDCLNRTTAFFALLAARLRGCRCVGIVTDLPDMLGGGRFYRRMANYVIAHCTDYVFLTGEMNTRLNPTGKPHVILEGHADITMEEKHPSPEKKEHPRVCLYAGSVCRLFGLSDLVEGFRMAELPDTRLVIYGQGDYVPELQAIAAEDPRIVYGGMLLSSQVVEKEMSATLLVNPRPTNEEYVKYSFPSKTMEYMASGTPVLTTALPGMPKEYYPHVFLIHEETPAGIAQALKDTLSRTDADLFRFGCKARAFVLKERNNIVQAGKILAMLEASERK